MGMARSRPDRVSSHRAGCEMRLLARNFLDTGLRVSELGDRGPCGRTPDESGADHPRHRPAGAETSPCRGWTAATFEAGQWGHQVVNYFTNYGPRGSLRYRDLPGSLGVLSARDQHLPVGQADCLGPDQDGNAIFTLRVEGQAIEGRWLLIDREFRPVT